jgi:hypothetical protein
MKSAADHSEEDISLVPCEIRRELVTTPETKATSVGGPTRKHSTIQCLTADQRAALTGWPVSATHDRPAAVRLIARPGHPFPLCARELSRRKVESLQQAVRNVPYILNAITLARQAVPYQGYRLAAVFGGDDVEHRLFDRPTRVRYPRNKLDQLTV